MAVNKKSLENLKRGKQFSSNNQPANPGRKPSALRFIRDEGVSITDIKKIIGSLIWEYDSEELEELLKTVEVEVKVKDKEGNIKTETIKKLVDPVPMGVNLVLGALTDDLKQKSIYNFKSLMNITYGKPEKTVNIGAISLETLAVLNEVFAEKPEQKESKRKPKANGRKPGSTEN